MYGRTYANICHIEQTLILHTIPGVYIYIQQIKIMKFYKAPIQ